MKFKILKLFVCQEECPINRASFLSVLTFWWVNPLINLGYKRPLTLDDMWAPLQSFLTEYNLKNFNKNYYNLVSKARVVSMIGSDYKIVRQEQQLERSSGVLIPLLKTYWAFAFMLFIFRLTTSLMTFISPTLLDWLISFVSNPNEPLWKGLLYALILFLSSMVQSLIMSQNMYFANLIRLKMRACVTNTIYKKASDKSWLRSIAYNYSHFRVCCFRTMAARTLRLER